MFSYSFRPCQSYGYSPSWGLIGGLCWLQRVMQYTKRIIAYTPRAISYSCEGRAVTVPNAKTYLIHSEYGFPSRLSSVWHFSSVSVLVRLGLRYEYTLCRRVWPRSESVPGVTIWIQRMPSSSSPAWKCPKKCAVLAFPNVSSPFAILFFCQVCLSQA